MPKFDSIIPLQNFELIRDRIGLVLADELQFQLVRSQNSVFNVQVFIARMIPPNHTEMPLINVFTMRGDYGSKDVTSVRGSYTYIVDIFTAAPFSNAQQGDVKASIDLERLIGVCRAIIENPQYRTLDFAPPSIESVRVSSIEFAEPQADKDARSIANGRLLVEVIVPEGAQLMDAPTMAMATTTVRLQLTGKGYTFVRNDDPADAFIDQDSNRFIQQDGLRHFSPNPDDSYIAQSGEPFTSQQGDQYEHG